SWKKNMSERSTRTGRGQSSWIQCVPVCGQVPQRGLSASLDCGGSIPSLIAAQLSQGEVYEHDGVAVSAALSSGSGSGSTGIGVCTTFCIVPSSFQNSLSMATERRKLPPPGAS